MPRAFTPKVVTGNALLEGDVIYFTDSDSWTRNLKDAEVITDEAVESQAAEVVGAYLADVKVTEDGPEPTHFREDFRRTGPSNYFHGKQAEA